LDAPSDKDISYDSKHNLLCEYQQTGKSLVEIGLSREKSLLYLFSAGAGLALSRKETAEKHKVITAHIKCRVLGIGSCTDCCLMGCDIIDPEDGGNMFL
jgi:hypothetical protein